jgi:hypothetical protein
VAIVLLAAGTVWLFINKQFGEGPMLWRIAEDHALMLSDLLSLAAWAIAVILWCWPTRRPPSGIAETDS